MPEAKMFFNKRSHPRVPAHLTVTYLVMKGHPKDRGIQDLLEGAKTAETVDASLGGMLLGGHPDLAAGDMVTLKFALPSRQAALSAFAKVAWVNAAGAGVTFVSMTEEDRKALDLYLKSFAPGA
ncbi:MAG TPA: PilZ domain-containing protein [bacterium]|nr:PilZ domain-containing protein [bacterium]